MYIYIYIYMYMYISLSLSIYIYIYIYIYAHIAIPALSLAQLTGMTSLALPVSDFFRASLGHATQLDKLPSSP